MRKKVALVLMVALLMQSISVWADVDPIIFPEERGGVEKFIQNISENGFLFEGNGMAYTDNQENRQEVLSAVTSENIAPVQEENAESQQIPEQSASANGAKEEGISLNGVSMNGDEEISKQTVSVNDVETMPEETVSMNGTAEEGISSNSVSVNGNEEMQQDFQEETDAVSVNVSSNTSSNAAPQEKGKESVSAGEKKLKEKEIIKISIPDKVKIWFDPYKLSGRGGIFSEKYEIANYGNEDIAVKIKSAHMVCSSLEDEYEFIKEGTVDIHSKKKAMHMNMVWVNESEHLEKVLNVSDGQIEEYVIYLKAAEYDKNGKFVKLNEGSKGEFFFEGELNSNPNVEWLDGKISVDYKYEIVSCGEENIRDDIEDFIGNAKNLQIPSS